jgi:outer membrane receptor protein involved in Fe transport
MVHENRDNVLLRLAVRAALTGGTVAVSFGVANAQTPPTAPTTASDAGLSEVVVTGSRIAVPNAVSISPITTVSADTIQQTGATRIEDLLNSLPQVFADQGANVSNGSDGTAAVDLRGLGSKRTLVLVDGLRLGPGDPRGGNQSDLNMIPAELVESVDVLTGGASSTYGADAVAGVVNFKLMQHFEGVKLEANAGIYNHQNDNTQGVQTVLNDFNTNNGTNFASAPSSVNTGAQKDLAFLAGLNSPDGNGNATFYATYRNVAAVLQSKYSYSACTLSSGYVTSNSGRFNCSGSSTSYPGRFFDLNTGTDNTVGPGNQLTPFANADRYNYGPLNYYQRPDERYTAGSFLHYDFNEHATVYASTMFMDDRSIAQIAPSGAFFAGATYQVNCNNPFLSTSMVADWCGGVASSALSDPLWIGRRSIETLGAKGAIDDAWSYDASYQYSIVNLSETYYNDVSSSRVNNALNVIDVNGVPTCASTVNGTSPVNQAILGSCVPWDIFQLGGVTKAAAAYISVPGLLRGKVEQTVVDANFTGDLGKYGVQLPTANSGLHINVGAEWRDTNSYTEPDAEYQTGDLAGQGAPTLPVSGIIIAREAFAEARLPLIEDKPFVQALDLEAGYRYSDYSLGFKTNTYKFGVDFAPISDVRLRASFARAVRAPNVGELYSAQSVGLDGSIDPCSGSNPSFSQAACARTGVTAAQYGNVQSNPAAQYNGLTGGNPNLQPETALTSSFGIGFTPSFVPNLRLQFDYSDIKIENVVSTIGANNILNYCLKSDLFCSLIHRDQYGTLFSSQGYIVDALANVGQLEVQNIDVDASYSFSVGSYGKISTQFIGTYLMEYETTAISANPSTAYNCAGYYGPSCGTPNFKWRHTMRTTWSTPWSGLDVSVAWRFFSPVTLDELSPNSNITAAAGSTIANGFISNTDARLSSRSYIDLTAAVKVGEKVTVRLGCNNVFDKDPPLVGTTNLPGVQGNGNTFPQIYDSLGRYLFAQVTAQF